MSMTGYSVHDLDPHAAVVRYMCRVCKEPLGFPPPPTAGWVCPDDEGMPVPMTLDDVVKLVDLELLHQLWQAALGYRPWQIDGRSTHRQAWVAHAYVKAKPEHGHDTAIYKAIERLGVGAIVLTPDQVVAQATNTKFRKGLIR